MSCTFTFGRFGGLTSTVDATLTMTAPRIMGYSWPNWSRASSTLNNSAMAQVAWAKGIIMMILASHEISLAEDGKVSALHPWEFTNFEEVKQQITLNIAYTYDYKLAGRNSGQTTQG